MADEIKRETESGFDIAINSNGTFFVSGLGGVGGPHFFPIKYLDNFVLIMDAMFRAGKREKCDEFHRVLGSYDRFRY